MRSFIAIVLGICVSAAANPTTSGIVITAVGVHITDEHLVLTVSPTNMTVAGTFSFAAPPGPWNSGTAQRLDVRIWLPATGLNKTIEESLQRATNHDFLSHHSLSPHDIDAVKRALAFNMRIADETAEVDHAWLDNAVVLGGGAAEAGFDTLVFSFEFKSKIVAGKSWPLAISYQQPSLRLPRGGKFYYLPIFSGLPSSLSTTDTNRYAVVVRPEAGCTLAVTNGTQVCTIHSGESVVCSPSHYQPIQGLAWPDANKSRHRMSGNNINLRPERLGMPILGALCRTVRP